MRKIIVLIILIFTSCKNTPTELPKEALNDVFLSIDDKETSFKDIIKKHKGSKIVIDTWASWCRDCIINLPKLKKLQQQHPKVIFLFLSLDKSVLDWKASIKKHNIKGEHYFVPSGWNGTFAESISINWIPRYLILDENGKLLVYKETNTNARIIKKALEK